MKKFFLVMILGCAFILSAISACGFEDTWTGTYYPDGCLTCEEEYIFRFGLKSLEECRDWAAVLKEESGNPNDTYECGKNCEISGSFLICEETLD